MTYITHFRPEECYTTWPRIVTVDAWTECSPARMISKINLTRQQETESYIGKSTRVNWRKTIPTEISGDNALNIRSKTESSLKKTTGQ